MPPWDQRRCGSGRLGAQLGLCLADGPAGSPFLTPSGPSHVSQCLQPHRAQILLCSPQRGGVAMDGEWTEKPTPRELWEASGKLAPCAWGRGGGERAVGRLDSSRP